MNNGAHEKQSLSHKIVRNTLYNTLGRFWGVLVGLFLTPYIIHRIGIERFGVWALVSVITGYFGLLDLGIGTSFVKYIADFYTKKEYGRINKLVNTGFISYAIFTILATALFIFLANPIMQLLKIPPYINSEAVFVFLAGIIIFGVSNAMSPFASVQTGLQRMDITNMIAIVVSIANIFGTILFLENGFGLIGLMVNNIIVTIVGGAITIYMSFKILPALEISLRYVDRNMFMKIINFGYKLQITRISGVIVAQTDKLLITLFLSLSLVSFYQLGSTIVYQVISVAGLLTSVLLPAFSEIHSGGNKRRLVEAYLRSIKYVAFFTAPLFIFVGISAPIIMALWMGEAVYGASSMVIQILMFGFLINTIAQASGTLCIAVDRPEIMAKSAIILAVLNITISTVLIKTLGFSGAAWGLAISVNIATLYFLFVTHRHLGIRNISAAKTVVPYIGLSVFAGVIVLILDALIGWARVIEPRPVEFMILVTRALCFCCVYVACVYFMKLFNKSEIDFWKEKLSGLRQQA